MLECTLFKTVNIEIGVFQISPEDPGFSQAGFVDAPIIVFPKKSIWIQHDGFEPFVADPTIVNYYNQGQVYNRFAINHSGDYCHWFRISDPLLSEVVAREQVHFSVQNRHCPSHVFLQHLELLQKVMSVQPAEVLEIEEETLMMFHDLLKENTSHDQLYRQSARQHKRLVERVKESIQSDLSVNLTLQQLSQIHHTSPYHLSRVFKTVCGHGINHYRTQQRLRSLLLKLHHNSNDLVELALEFGFSSHSHMSASFKQVFGFTPSSCQKLIFG